MKEAIVMAAPQGAERGDDLCVVVSCMGRLSFLKQTVPTVLAHPVPRYCLVDYSCPELCGEWIQRSYPSETETGRVIIEAVTGRERFNKSAAFNAGARRAIAEGAKYICFLDADTIVKRGFFDWLVPELGSGRFLIVALDEDGYDVPSLTGVLAVAADDFAETDGFDESFEGWGAEDIEFRLRLHMLHGLSHADIPLPLVQPLEHDDALRTSFYDEKAKLVSERRNSHRMLEKVRRWQPGGVSASTAAQRLTYHARPLRLPEHDAAGELLSLAEVYCSTGRYAEAERTYEQFLQVGRWDEAVWYSMFRLGLVRLKLGRPWSEVEAALLGAYGYRPTRAEPLWVLAVLSRNSGLYDKAYHYSKRGAAVPQPETDSLDVQRDIYEWKVLKEYALAAAYIGQIDDARAALQKLLSTPALPDSERALMLKLDQCVAELGYSSTSSAPTVPSDGEKAVG